MKPLAFFAAICCMQLAHGAPFTDPTRPPTVGEEMSAGATLSQGPRLESVLIAPDRSIAVISGQQVVVGTRIATGEVVKISESEVVIRGAEGTQTLRLFPELRRAAAREKGKKP